MILKICLLVTLVYYLFLWRIYAKKKAFDRAAKEVFGPATGIQELLAQQETANLQLISEKIVEKEVIDTATLFGPTTDIKTVMANLHIQTTPSTKLDTSIGDTPTKIAKPPLSKKGLPSPLSQQLATMDQELQTTKIKVAPSPLTRRSPLTIDKNTRDKNAKIEELQQFFE